jgi:NOL1/NOP2/fmu family ribosome biogenesis protein
MGYIMLNYKILNSKEIKNILEILKEQFGVKYDKNLIDYTFLMNKDYRIYVVSKDLGRIPYDEMKIDAVGIYFGELYKEKLRLSIEGSQIIGKDATKNVVELEYNQMIEWIKGQDVMFEDCGQDFVIVKYKNPKTNNYDILGCGRYNAKEGKLMNYVSKSRKLIVVND